MNAKEYLHQAYRLDNRINSDLEELARLRELSVSISSPAIAERVQSSRSKEAPFVKCFLKIRDLEEKINSEIDQLVDLKDEIRSVIDRVKDPDEQMVLRYRYINGMSWEQIGEELSVDRTTVYRWHNMALHHVILPDESLRI